MLMRPPPAKGRASLCQTVGTSSRPRGSPKSLARLARTDAAKQIGERGMDEGKEGREEVKSIVSDVNDGSLAASNSRWRKDKEERSNGLTNELCYCM